MVSVDSPDVLIPCEMDWLAYHRVEPIILFGKEGKLGLYSSWYEHSFLAPEYSAYDISTLRFCRDGVWGWVSRTTGEFFSEPVGDRLDMMIPVGLADSILDTDDKPEPEYEEEDYMSLEDFHSRILDGASEFQIRLKYKLKSLLELPPLKFSKGYKAPARIVDAIRALSPHGEGLCVCVRNYDAPEIHITCSLQGKRKIYRLEWSPKSNALAWYDIPLIEREAFHQLILAQKDSFSMHFCRDFNGREAHTMAKFIAYYFSVIWNAHEEDLIIRHAEGMTEKIFTYLKK